MRFRYSRWDGTQEVAPFDPDELIESLSEELLSDGDVRTALQRILQRGFQSRTGDRTMGLQQLLERLRQQRQQRLDRYDLGGIMDQIKEKLDDVIRTEREGIARRLAQVVPGDSREPLGPTGNPHSDQASATGPSAEDAESDEGLPSDGPGSDQDRDAPTTAASQGTEGPEGGRPSWGVDSQSPGDPQLQKLLEDMAQRRLQQLDALPPDVGGQIQQLREYEFMDPGARQKFQELLDLLQQQLMQSYFQGMQQAMQSLGPQDLAAAAQMLRDLNQMLRDRAEGREPDLEDFMAKWGQNFPEGIESLDDLVAHLQDRLSQMQSLLDSMTPEQRRQLQDMAEQLMDRAGMSDDLAELSDLLQALAPGARRDRPYPFRGNEPVSLLEAMQLMDQLQQMDSLERDLQQARDLEGVNRVDADKVRELIGDDAAESLAQLRDLQRMLEEAGYVTRKGQELELTPRAMRKIGEKALRDIFHHLKRDSFGRHEIDERGPGGERVDESKIYEFGDPFVLDMHQTLMNAVVREGTGTPIRLAPVDFEVHKHELITQSSTVIVLDMSRSMFLRGCILAAKKVTVALNALIKGLYPRDHLYIIAFSAYAREISPEDLPHLTWADWGYGTNMQHAFMVSRQLLGRHKSGTKQVILVTDGEPTAHFEGGHVEFSYPPTYRTFQETLREVKRCTRENVTINTFMMERGRYLTDFVDQMTRINKGRAFYATPDRLGEYILVDYVDNKRRSVR
ncbi:MAG: VWA domain-containing protein [Chloroflexi bacterium]|nr:VWA domain-containing protein [Chloroflexota bacterium]